MIFSIFISIPIIAQEESINQIIEYGLKRAENQSLILAQELKTENMFYHVLMRIINYRLYIMIIGYLAFSLVFFGYFMRIIKIRNLENMQNYIQHV